MANENNQRYHLSKDGVPRECKADVGACPIDDGDGNPAPHGEFGSMAEAQAWSESVLESQAAGYMQGLGKKTQESSSEIRPEALEVIMGNAASLEEHMWSYAGGDPEEVEENGHREFPRRSSDPREGVKDILSYMFKNKDNLNAKEADALMFYVSAAEYEGAIVQSTPEKNERLYGKIQGMVNEFVEDGRLEKDFDRQSHFNVEGDTKTTAAPESELGSETLGVLQANVDALSESVEEYKLNLSKPDRSIKSNGVQGSTDPRDASWEIISHMMKNKETLKSEEIETLMFYVSAAEHDGKIYPYTENNQSTTGEIHNLVEYFIKDGRLKSGFDPHSYFDPARRGG